MGPESHGRDTAAPKVPSPLPYRMLALPELMFAVTKSAFPSPSRSAVAMS